MLQCNLTDGVTRIGLFQGLLYRFVVIATLLMALGVPSFGVAKDYMVFPDIAYGEHPRQRLDIYSPGVTNAQTPVVVFFHGGEWQTGSKADLPFIGRSFARAGVMFLVPNYRLYPDAVFPEFIEDSAMAVSYAWRELRTDGGSPRPLFVAGHSAGAYNAAMVALDQRYLAALGVPSGAINGVIGLAGQYDATLCKSERCAGIFPESVRAQSAAIDFMDGEDPPILFVASVSDEEIPMDHIVEVAATAERGGIDVTTLVVSGVSHRKVLSELLDANSVVRTSIAAFMKRMVEG